MDRPLKKLLFSPYTRAIYRTPIACIFLFSFAPILIIILMQNHVNNISIETKYSMKLLMIYLVGNHNLPCAIHFSCNQINFVNDANIKIIQYFEITGFIRRSYNCICEVCGACTTFCPIIAYNCINCTTFYCSLFY